MSDDNSSSSENESLSEAEINQAGKRKHVKGSQIKSVKKRRKKDLLKPPTTEELNQLRETENLYSSNLIRLQIEELLSEINLNQKHIVQFDQWWSYFLEIIKNVPEENDVLLSTLEKCNNNKVKKNKNFINVLYENKTNINCDRDYVLKFLKPGNCTIFREYELQCSTKTNKNVFVDVKMPSECLSGKDYLNNRYFIKRHYYLVYILHYIREKTFASKIELIFYENINFMPMIQITPQFSDEVRINIFVSGSEDFFKLDRFLPDRNNIKYHFDDNFSDIDVKAFAEVSTPIHNSFLARDFTLHINYLDLKKSLATTNIQDGMKLLMLWLTQRELNSSFNSFTNELLFYTVSYLVKKKKISSLMSSYQVVRIFWSFMVNTKWNEEPISLCDDFKLDRLNMYTENYDVVFLDITGFFNVASFLHLGVYQKVKQEAQLALKILDGNKFNSFSSLFLAKTPYALQYDALIKLNSKDNFKKIYRKASSANKWKYYGFYNSLILNEITEILREGFTNRVTNIVPYFYEQNSTHKKTKGTDVIVIGINLNPEYAFNVIEKGPSENNPELIKKFQTFWNGMTSFRRFQDSTTAEVVHFPCRTLQDKRNIFLKILNFVLVQKYDISIRVVSNEFEKILKLEKTISHFPTGSNEEACLKVIHTYTDLARTLRNMELPLMITHIQGISDVFSYTEVFPPVPTTYKEEQNITQCNGNNLTLRSDIKSLPAYVSPIECVIQLGKTSGWPNDLEVLQVMKCEFYLRISDLLEKEENIISSVTTNYIDIFYKGLVFRFRLYIPKEYILLRWVIDKNGVSYRDNEKSLKLEKHLDIGPKITSALSGIHQESPSFGPCCALVKRWLRSQLIDDFLIPDVVINLWCASFYINDPPYTAPVLPQIAFLRFLKYLMDFNWQLNAVVVNFNDEIKSTDLSDIEAKFQENRSNYPSLYIITPYDQARSIFTKPHPSKYILRRIKVLATDVYKFLSDVILNWPTFSVTDFFIPSLKGYDVVIHLNSTMNALSYQSVNIDADVDKNFIEKYDEKVSNKIPIRYFNPVQLYLSELREIYENYAVFFHDSYGGNVIGILWNKLTADPREFKVSQVDGRKILNGKLSINYDAIIEDIYNRGHGIIKNIEKM